MLDVEIAQGLQPQKLHARIEIRALVEILVAGGLRQKLHVNDGVDQDAPLLRLGHVGKLARESVLGDLQLPLGHRVVADRRQTVSGSRAGSADAASAGFASWARTA